MLVVTFVTPAPFSTGFAVVDHTIPLASIAAPPSVFEPPNVAVFAPISVAGVVVTDGGVVKIFVNVKLSIAK